MIAALPVLFSLISSAPEGTAATSSTATLAGTSTLTATSSTGVPVLLPGDLLELASDAESQCTLAGGRGHLTVEGLRWKGWENFCEVLEIYLRLGPEESRDARRDEKLLLDTGFFATADCREEAAPAGLDCTVKPRMSVRDVEIEGRLPFVLLEDDIRRRVFLRPGTIIDKKSVLADQERRIESFLERQGFFESKAKVTLSVGRSGAEPNLGVELELDVQSGRTLTLGEVRVTGETGLEANKIEGMVRHYWLLKIFPRRFSQEILDEDIEAITKKLAKKGWPEATVRASPSLDLENGHVILGLEIDAGAHLELVFKGNEDKDDGDLEDLVTFQKAGSMDSVEVENSADAIREDYQASGYYEVKVTPTVEDRTDGQHERVVTFTIEEGPKAEVESVEIEGNTTFDDDQVASGAQLKTHDGKLFSSGRWIDTRVTRDIRAIRAYYVQQGFADTKVGASRTLLPDGNLAVAFTIEEGPRRTVGSLEVKGLPSDVWLGEIDRKLALRPGQPFIEDRLEADRRLVLTVLAAHGYAHAVVKRRLKVPYKTEGGEASIEYIVEPNERSLFGGFLLRGAFRTRDSVIEDELDLEVGEPLDLLALSEAKQRLRTLGVFGSVDLKPIGSELGTKDTWLLVDVTEYGRPTLDLVFSFSTADLFRVGADFRDSNFVGRAIYLNVSARLANASRIGIQQRIGRSDQIVAEVRAPHPLGLPFNAEYSAFYNFEDQVRRNKDDQGMEVVTGYERKRVGATAGISRTLVERDACKYCPELVGRIGYELASIDGVNYGGDLSNQIADTPNSTIGRIVPQLSVRRVDSPLDPRKGYSSNVRFEVAQKVLAGPLKDPASFWRLLTSLELYWKLGTPFTEELSETVTFGGPFVIASGTTYAVGHPFSGSHELPITETFDYGGDLSVRGLQERASLSAVPTANYLLTESVELRYYFLATSFGSFQIAGLLDAGMVSRHLNDLISNPTFTSGAAFRYVTPVGPLSVAYAVPLKLAEGIQSKGRLHVSFGYSF